MENFEKDIYYLDCRTSWFHKYQILLERPSAWLGSYLEEEGNKVWFLHSHIRMLGKLQPHQHHNNSILFLLRCSSTAMDSLSDVKQLVLVSSWHHCLALFLSHPFYYNGVYLPHCRYSSVSSNCLVGYLSIIQLCNVIFLY